MSEKPGLSVSFLSLVERDKVSISVENLQMVHPTHTRQQSFGMEEKNFVFELRNEPANDMERILMAQEKGFGPVDGRCIAISDQS